MSMNRIQQTFAVARAAGRPAFVAYLTMGFPSLAESEAAADRLLGEDGADILELGVPFSDPFADGATIRTAAYEAIRQGVTLDDVLAAAARIRARHPKALLVLFSYYNLLFSKGPAACAEAAAAAGIDAVLAVDLPLEERAELLAELRKRGLTMVMLIAPNTPIERVVESARGLEDSFLYAITVKGTTGVREAGLPSELADRLEAIRAAVPVPVVAGFGISSRAQGEQIGRHADGFVIGSAIVRRLAEGGLHDGRPLA
jgi:tryptophan synthase alpha chain